MIVKEQYHRARSQVPTPAAERNKWLDHHDQRQQGIAGRLVLGGNVGCLNVLTITILRLRIRMQDSDSTA